MKFTIPQSALYQALQRMISIIPLKTTIPILTNILFDLRGNRLQLTGTDLEVSIITGLEVIGEEDGSAAFPAKRLFDLVRELPDIPLRLEAEANNRLTIKTEKGNYKIAGESSDEYPHISTEKQTTQFSYRASRFMSTVEKVIFAVSADELRTTLMGMLLEIRKDELRLVATDGHRLVKVRDTKFTFDGAPNQVVIPVKSLHLLGRNMGDGDEMTIGMSQEHITFVLGQTTIYSKLISGHYPAYERVIPTSNPLTMTVDRELLGATVRRSSIFANQHTRQIKWTLEPGALTIHAQDAEMSGDSQETIPVEYAGDPMDIGYNANYVLEILRHLDTESILFKLKDGASAAIIEPVPQPEDLEVMMLLMPIRINE